MNPSVSLSVVTLTSQHLKNACLLPCLGRVLLVIIPVLPYEGWRVKLCGLVQEHPGSVFFHGFDFHILVYIKCTGSNKLNCWSKPPLLLQIKHSDFEKSVSQIKCCLSVGTDCVHFKATSVKSRRNSEAKAGTEYVSVQC